MKPRVRMFLFVFACALVFFNFNVLSALFALITSGARASWFDIAVPQTFISCSNSYTHQVKGKYYSFHSPWGNPRTHYSRLQHSQAGEAFTFSNGIMVIITGFTNQFLEDFYSLEKTALESSVWHLRPFMSYSSTQRILSRLLMKERLLRKNTVKAREFIAGSIRFFQYGTPGTDTLVLINLHRNAYTIYTIAFGINTHVAGDADQEKLVCVVCSLRSSSNTVLPVQ